MNNGIKNLFTNFIIWRDSKGFKWSLNESVWSAEMIMKHESIEFANWISNNNYTKEGKFWWDNTNKGEYITGEELYNEYLKDTQT